ncbi:MAG: helix-turn-helix domain-containing protein [Pseudomonadota bacterium]
MYLDPAIAKSRVGVRRKALARGSGGGVRVYAELKETPFVRLAPGDLLDSADIARLYGVSTRTVYRWIAEANLRPKGKAGRDYYFAKAEILRWDDNDKPAMGRPWR